MWKDTEVRHRIHLTQPLSIHGFVSSLTHFSYSGLFLARKYCKALRMEPDLPVLMRNKTRTPSIPPSVPSRHTHTLSVEDLMITWTKSPQSTHVNQRWKVTHFIREKVRVVWNRCTAKPKDKSKVKVTHTHTHTQKNILPSFSRPVLARYNLRPALAGSLINWPFHLVNVHRVSGFVRLHACASVCVYLGTLSEPWSVWLPHWRLLLSQLLKACNRRPSDGENTHPHSSEKMWHLKRLWIIKWKIFRSGVTIILWS